MLKIYFYISMLLVTLALSGCTNHEADNAEATAETLANERSSTIINEDNSKKTVKVEPIPLNLTQEQKEDYYQKYVTIIERVNAANNEDFELELEPITDFLEEYWIEIEDFEKIAKERANASIVVVENNERFNPMAVPKTVTLKIGSKEANIIFKGSFDTQLNENTSKGRQLFSIFNGISSEAVDANGSWTQLGYEESLIEGKTVYKIAVGGNYSQSGIISSHIIEMEFHCDINGGIS
ncbi:hypothetical protein FH508_0013355 [Lysinibacillus sp. CD3-6]|uniref:hypothetical protein n=1 Tax=Lysinibacillus sp. CD3-6 TaxID=2892541 RepID=UPI00116C1994|nr:hypothetical protein [Lysinibacillus sp. CD3-6]UED78449.1 hypothetical protein FH508_0013355 [Lysinibacillus sp. CD3-6]